MEKEITDYLVEKYNATAVLLCGSRANGTNTDKSDWDLYVFSDKSENSPGMVDFSELKRYKDQTLDVFIVSSKVDENYVLETGLHPEGEIKILHDDSGGKVQKIVDFSVAKYNKGPAELSQRDKDVKVKILRKIIDKVESRKQDLHSNYFLFGKFHSLSIIYWFQINGKWPVPAYRAMSKIKEDDSVFYELLDQLVASDSEVSVDSKLSAMEHIIQHLFGINP